MGFRMGSHFLSLYALQHEHICQNFNRLAPIWRTNGENYQRCHQYGTIWPRC